MNLTLVNAFFLLFFLRRQCSDPIGTRPSADSFLINRTNFKIDYIIYHLEAFIRPSKGPSINCVASVGRRDSPKDNLQNSRLLLSKKTTRGGQKFQILRRHISWTAPNQMPVNAFFHAFFYNFLQTMFRPNRNKTVSGFFLAGRHMWWLPVSYYLREKILFSPESCPLQEHDLHS